MKNPKWFYERLELPSDAKVGDFLQLGSRGPVVIRDRVFDQKEPIDLDLGLFQIKREQGSPFLEVRISPDETYLFEFRPRVFASGYWLKWTKETVSPSGDLVPFPLPRITWMDVLFWSDASAELGEFIVASIILYVVGALAVSFFWWTLGRILQIGTNSLFGNSVMPTPVPADRFECRDLAILRHAAEYGLVLNAVVSKLFFGGKEPGHVIRRLCDAGLLELFPRALPGSISFARLSKRGCIRIGVSEKLSQPLSGHALNQAVSVVTYTVLGKYRRMRLAHAEMRELFGPDCPHANITHVLLSPGELSQYAVMRVVYCGHTLLETRKQLLRLIEESSRNKSLADAMAGIPSYGFLCLCPTEAPKKALTEALARTGSFQDVLLCVDVGPGVEELPAFLKALRGTDR